MIVWNWYMTRTMQQRVAIIAGLVIFVVLMVGTISSLTDEDENDEDDVAVADDDPPYSVNGSAALVRGQGEEAIAP